MHTSTAVTVVRIVNYGTLTANHVDLYCEQRIAHAFLTPLMKNTAVGAFDWFYFGSCTLDHLSLSPRPAAEAHSGKTTVPCPPLGLSLLWILEHTYKPFNQMA